MHYTNLLFTYFTYSLTDVLQRPIILRSADIVFSCGLYSLVPWEFSLCFSVTAQSLVWPRHRSRSKVGHLNWRRHILVVWNVDVCGTSRHGCQPRTGFFTLYNVTPNVVCVASEYVGTFVWFLWIRTTWYSEVETGVAGKRCLMLWRLFKNQRKHCVLL